MSGKSAGRPAGMQFACPYEYLTQMQSGCDVTAGLASHARASIKTRTNNNNNKNAFVLLLLLLPHACASSVGVAFCFALRVWVTARQVDSSAFDLVRSLEQTTLRRRRRL